MPKGKKTEMIAWRGGMMEFARKEGCGFNSTVIAHPPWYVVRYRGGSWDKEVWNYSWIDYGGPPIIFLTRKQAEKHAKDFRRQYETCVSEVEVVKIDPQG